jgi:hypothetical protein
MSTVTVHGAQFSDVPGFLALVGAGLSLSPAPTTLAALGERVAAAGVVCTVRWSGAGRARSIQVRRSDVPLSELPAGGSNMMREVVLELIHATVSLHDKITQAFASDPNLTAWARLEVSEE